MQDIASKVDDRAGPPALGSQNTGKAFAIIRRDNSSEGVCTMQFRKHPWHDDVELRPSDTAEDGDAEDAEELDDEEDDDDDFDDVDEDDPDEADGDAPADAGGEDAPEEDDEDE